MFRENTSVLKDPSCPFLTPAQTPRTPCKVFWAHFGSVWACCSTTDRFDNDFFNRLTTLSASGRIEATLTPARCKLFYRCAGGSQVASSSMVPAAARP
jgi:hypothetical protein